MIRLNIPIEALIVNLQSSGSIHYNLKYSVIRNGRSVQNSVEGILTTSGSNTILTNDYSSGHIDIDSLNVTNIDGSSNFVSLLKGTFSGTYNLTSEAIGLNFRESINYTSEGGFRILDQNGGFKTFSESACADADVFNTDSTYATTVASGGTLIVPNSTIDVNSVPEGDVVSVKPIDINLIDSGAVAVTPTDVTITGNTITIEAPDSVVENSDASYTDTIVPGDTLVLPDSQVNVNSNNEGNVVSVKTIDINLVDGISPITPVGISITGNTIDIDIDVTQPVDIEINGNAYDTVNAPATVDIPVINSASGVVGVIAGLDVIIQDSTAVIKDSVGATIKTELILAEASENITINDSTVNVRQSDSTLISAVAVKAENSDDYIVADSVIENSDASYSANVLATDPLTLPDSQINVNSNNEGNVVSVKTIDVDIVDSLSAPVVPTSVVLVGNTLTIEVPDPGATPSGVAYQYPKYAQQASYRTGDVGDRMANGWMDSLVNPAYPKAYAELDYEDTNWWQILKNPLIVDGVSSTNRFVDVDGGQTWSATDNKNLVTIDKLSSLMYYNRAVNNGNDWAAAIDAALAFSIVVDGVTYDDWYLPSIDEYLSLYGTERTALGGLYNPSATLIIGSNNNLHWSSTTVEGTTANAYYYATTQKSVLTIAKTTAGQRSLYVRKASNLITAP